MTDAAPPTVDQPAPLTQEQMAALVQDAMGKLEQARKTYSRALQISLTQPNGQIGIAPFPLLLDVINERIRVDAILMVLGQMGIDIGLPVVQVMERLYASVTEQLGKVQIASGVSAALNGRSRQ